MSEDTETDGLHLPSLSIRGFRGINRLDIERLGRVTLLAGKNGVGKTTVLEAASLYANRGDPPALASLLLYREEYRYYSDPHGEHLEDPNYEALFYGREPELDTEFTVGPMQQGETLRVKFVLPYNPRAWQQYSNPTELTEGFISAGPELRIAFGESERLQPLYGISLGDGPIAPERPWPMMSFTKSGDWPGPAPCVTVGPEVPENRDLAQHWDKIALTPQQSQAEHALQAVCAFKLEGVTLIGENGPTAGRRVIVKPCDSDRVSLRSLGDGAVRMFATALAVANAADGFLLIDEAENGLHHSLQPEYWAMVLRVAREHNVQVLATTHSWDCVAGFAHAAFDDEESQGLAIRLEADDDDGGVRAIEYSEDDLEVAATQGIEIR